MAIVTSEILCNTYIFMVASFCYSREGCEIFCHVIRIMEVGPGTNAKVMGVMVYR